MIHLTEMVVDKASSKEDGVLEFIASTNTVDRQGDIVEQNWELRAFRQNPVFLWGHDKGGLPIGKVIKIWTEKKKGADSTKETRIQVKFVPGDIFPFAQQVRELYEAGYLKAVSIGFRPLERAQVSDEQREALGMGPWGERFTKSELLEVSGVTVPANPEAVQTGVSKGLWTKEAASIVGADPTKGMDLEAVERAIDEMDLLPSQETEPEPQEEKSDEVGELCKRVDALVECVRLLIVKDSDVGDEDDESQADDGEEQPEEGGVDEEDLVAAINAISAEDLAATEEN